MAMVLLNYSDAVFGLTGLKSPPSFEIIVGEKARKSVASFLVRSGLKPGKFIVLNISAAEKERQLSHQQAAHLAQLLSTECRESVVVISAPADIEMRQSIAALAGGSVVSFPSQGNTDILTIAALLAECKAVITPDTSVIHLASAMRAPVMGLYTPLRVTNEWLPFRVLHRIVLAPQDKPVASISPKTIESEVKLFLGSVRHKGSRGKRRSAAGKGKRK
jgi:ADP-heptose:LPS heptosyltransferase